MDFQTHLAHLEADGPRLADAATEAGWDAAVPATEWTVRDLVTHTGGIHRWAADIVRTRSTTPRTDAGLAVGTGPSEELLLDWFREGHAALVAALREAPDDLDCFTFLPAPSPRAFWARRQAHETAIHRADAQAASGRKAHFDTDFAADGIAEILLGFGARRRSAPFARSAVLGLRADDGPTAWIVRLTGDQTLAEEVPGVAQVEPDATVTGATGQLYLWLWNRPAEVTVHGDASAAALWREVKVRWS
jgi:uncharacterized protein (TIGR03083 family)